MEEDKSNKIKRVLGIYTKLMNGHLINKVEEAGRYKVNERSIQRDIDDIRNYLADDAETAGYMNAIAYDRVGKGYRMEQIYRMKLSNSEILAICKILLDSRAFTKDEMNDILNRLVLCCAPECNQDLVKDLVRNELFHYVELRHKTHFLDKMWDIGEAIRSCHYIEIEYNKIKGKKKVKRILKPVAIMFSEYYFYIAAFFADEKMKKHFDVINDSSPTIYRIDRIKNMKVLDKQFSIPYRDRFQEGEFRKRVQFMYSGKLQKVRFKYSGENIEAVLDRLPTAEVLCEEDGVYTVAVEVFGKGIEMWLRSQGESVSDVIMK